ncbi:hypothetical protein EUGRSUZ_H01021 [Eucalyptus grandis]|uniref:Uncharacterized protein n=2 Tax=Eucalyptus grandis TaxID=71139 RepID=A0ACC3JN12_EUCGR|nr:hypothetical protein EUGRSUZ_H01021 [Eucalyptus grandis]
MLPCESGSIQFYGHRYDRKVVSNNISITHSSHAHHRFQCYNIEHLGCTSTDHALAPFHLEWFLISPLREVSAC